MKTILIINRPQIKGYWTLPFLFLKIQTNYNKVLEAEDPHWLKTIAKYLDTCEPRTVKRYLSITAMNESNIIWLK